VFVDRTAYHVPTCATVSAVKQKRYRSRQVRRGRKFRRWKWRDFG